MMLVGRVSGLLVVAGGLIFAYRVPNVVTALSIWFKIAPMMGIAFWMAVFWRRMTTPGAWAVTVTGFAAWWATTRPTLVGWLDRFPTFHAWGMLRDNNGSGSAIAEPWVILIYVSLSVVAGVAVSLLTRPVDSARLNLFYNLMRTPVIPDEKVSAPCELPAGATTQRRTTLCTAYGLEIPLPSMTSWLGFLAGWLSVGLMVGGFLWLVR